MNECLEACGDHMTDPNSPWEPDLSRSYSREAAAEERRAERLEELIREPKSVGEWKQKESSSIVLAAYRRSSSPERRNMRRQFVGALAALISLCSAGSTQAMTSQQVNVVVQAALSQVGATYVWGAENPGRSFDCSGLTQYAFACAGIALPRHSSDQLWACRMCVPLGTPGALMFFATDPHQPGVITHVGVCLGGDKMVDANSVAGRVVTESYNTNYWRRCFVAAAMP